MSDRPRRGRRQGVDQPGVHVEDHLEIVVDSDVDFETDVILARWRSHRVPW